MLAGGAAIGVVVLAAVPFLTTRADRLTPTAPGEIAPAEITAGVLETSAGSAESSAQEGSAERAGAPELQPEPRSDSGRDLTIEKPGRFVKPAARGDDRVEPPLLLPAPPPQAKGAIGPQILVGIKADPRAATMLKLWNSDPEGARRVYKVWAAAQRGVFDGLVLVDANPWSQELVLEVDPDAAVPVADVMRRLRDCPAVEYAERNTIGTTQDRN